MLFGIEENKNRTTTELTQKEAQQKFEPRGPITKRQF